MTRYIRARFSTATRLGVAILTAVILALMNGDRPAGQIATLPNAVDFVGTAAPGNQYITFGPATGANGLNATDFTLELWFKKEGAGVTTTTSGVGGGGISGGAVPLVAKGRGEADGTNVDMNYFLGLNLSAGVYTLAADFEDMGSPLGTNHAVVSSTAISDNIWYHAAATYSSTSGVFTLYLDGNPVGTITVPATPVGSRTPRNDSIQHASIGSALTSNGTAGGFFNGVIDEVRIWNLARTQTEIQAGRNLELTSGTGLIGRWGLNEGGGTVALNSVLGRPNGTFTNGPTRVVGGIPANAAAPTVPQNVTANIGNGLVTISFAENPELDLAGYNVYKNGSGTPLNVAPLTRPIFTDNTANGTLANYTVRAIDAFTPANLSAPSTAVPATPNALAGAGMQFNGTNQSVTFGQAGGTSSGLGAQQFTLETWFKRTGFGVATTTGTGGTLPGVTDVIPLISKGMAEAETPATANMNYLLGISASSGRLVADFEDTVNGGNHPITGNTPIPISTTEWHHAAATYEINSSSNIGTWRLYLDGNPDGTLTVGVFTPESTSLQHAAIATALNTNGNTGGNPQGFFAGLMDEVRIWNVARSQADIQATMFEEVNPATATGLIGRWALNEASGATAVGSARSINGTLVGTPTWTAGYSFPANLTPPAAPQDLAADPGNARVSLTWTANTEPDLAGYNVYRSTSSPVSLAGSPVNGSTLLTLPNYLNLGLTNGTQYFYVVTAVDALGNSSLPSNEVNATPLASLNQTPIVTAGPDRVIDFAGVATLSGAATDDGPFGVTWSQISGPAPVTFGNANLAATTATLTEPGTYVLRLTADDGAKSAFDEMTVTVNFVLTGAGDVAPNCVVGDSTANAQATATLLDGLPGPVFTLGDNSYVDGTAQQFATCYEPTWGRHKARTRPVTGNHDYNTPGATGYYNYFNGVGVQNGPAGDRTLGGYYSYNVGNWHIVVLNSECGTSPELWNSDGCAAGSPQEVWLRDDLANSPTNNIIAMWHRPRYSSSSDDAAHAYVQPLWQALYEYGTDIYLGGHWHNYERLAPMDASGQPDDDFGIRTFVIGTAGVPVSGAFPNQRSTSQVRNSTAHGVMKFTLKEDSFDWQFYQVDGELPSFSDSGSANVHGAPGSQPPVVNAGPDQTIGAGATELAGSVTDDGPNMATWSQVSGPAAAVFGNVNSPATSVGFTTAGTYVLQLTVDDDKYISSDTVSVTVTSATGNLPPMVNVGGDQFVTLPNHASLTATLNDDGFTGIDVSPTWTNQTPAVGTVTFDDPNTTTTTASFSAPGTYVLRLTATDGEVTGFDELTVTVSPVEPNNAIDFTGTNAYVTLGVAPQLGASKLTIEAWFRRDGAGTTADTGSGGFLAVPIVTKGRAQDEATTNNMNYFLGIVPGTGGAPDVLGADFEDSATGLNHPARGLKPVPADGVWHHAAATYDGKDWRLYLDGALDTTTPVGNQDQFQPRSDSIQHASIGSALNTGGTAEGLFNGVIDEVRIWSKALSLAELQARINTPISNDGNLIGRFGLNETGGGTTVVNSIIYNPVVNGTIFGSGWTRVAGAPFNLVFNSAPNMPVLNTPDNGATGETTAPNLSVNVSDPENQPLNVTFFGRAANAAAAGDFTIVAIPDTQHYVDDTNPSDADGDRALTFTQQTQWIVSSRPTLNTVFVSHLGDIAEHIDAQPAEWTKADASMDVLDLASPPVPYGIAPGNHDMSSAGVSTNYDLYFPVSRMSGYPWYGGYLGQNQFSFTDPIDRQNKNQYSLFSVGGMDFVVIHLEYDMPTYSVAWADRVLKAFPNRKAIIATHLFLSDSGSRPTTVLNRTTDGTPAATVWTNLIVPNCNVFLILNGHYPGEANRSDATPTNAACPSRTVHQLESDYQSRINGGDGWLRYMTFKPSENKIYVYTYSPKLLQFETDANSQFVLDFNMQGVPFTQIATNSNVTSGNDTQTTWSGRTGNTQYQWYATVSDGSQTVTGPTWSFTTAATGTPPAISTQPQSQTIASNATANLSVVATGTAPLTYQWYRGTAPDTTNLVGTNSPSFTTPNLTLQTNYWVRVSNSLSSINSNTATISIGAGAGITTQPQSQTIASNATANLSVVATGTAPLTYQWYRGTAPDTTNLVGTNSASFTTPALTTATSYWVRVSNTFGTLNSSTATISIGAGAGITTQPQSQTIASNATANLSVVATGTAPLTYQWYRGTAPDTTNLVGTNSASFTTPALTTATSYWVRVSNTFGTLNSSTATISIGAGAGITTQPQSQTIASNATANLSVVATGTAPLTYQWYRGTAPDTTNLVGTNSASFTTPALTTATSYWVRVSNTFGTLNSSTATISIGAGAGITTQPQSQTIASNATANLSVVATGTAPLTYQWYRGTAPDTTNLVGTNSASFTTPALTTATSYWVRVSNTFGTLNSSTATISIGAGAGITTQPQSQTIASNATANLSVVATGTAPLTYQWYRGTAPDTTNLVGTNSASFTTPALTTATSYWVRVSNTFGTLNSSTATISIGVGPGIATQPASQSIPSNTTANLSVVATGTGLSYQWYQGTSGTTTAPVGIDSASFTTPALTTATNYWVRVTNTFGTANSNTAAITIGGGPTINTHPASQAIVSNTTANLSVVATGTGLSYQWYQGTSGTTTAPVGINSASFNTPALTTATNYWVRVTNTFGSADSNTAAITIGLGPGIATHPASQTIASNTTANLSVVATGTGLSYQWFRGTAPDTTNLVGTNSASFTTPALTTATSYWVRVSNTFGAINSNTATVSIGVDPPVTFTPLGVGTHFPTTDNADGPGPGPRAVTPPAVQLGDMVVIVAAYGGTATLTMSETGGQAWTAEANTQANGETVRVFWSQFNGTWTANPAVTNTTGTGPLTVYSFAVDLAPGTYPEIDVPFLSGNHTGGTVTVPAFTTNTPGALALVGWISADNNTWAAPTTGWSMPGGQAQWRNNSSADNSIALAYRNIASVGTTGSIALTQTNGPDAGLYFRMAFKATPLTPATPPADPANLLANESIGQVDLTWADTSTNEFAFQIERCTNAGCTNFAPLTGVGSNVTSYRDTTVAGTTTYRYRVRANNVFGPSGYSNIDDATTPTPPFTFRGVGTHFPTVENADQGAGPGPRAIVPPASLQLGDLVVIVAAYRGTATLTLTETGGQIWTSEANTQANGQTVRVFWSQFNGVWTANPAVSNTTGTSPLTVYSMAFDMAPGLYPEIDVPFGSGSHSGGTVTVPTFTTNTTGVLALAGWISGDNNSWSAPTAGWSTPGGQAQWRNSNGSDSSVAFAYRLLGSAGPSGTIVRTQSASGPDTGIYFRLGFRALEVPSNPPADPSDLQAAASVGQVALTWIDHATNESGFNIERCAGLGCTNFVQIGVAGPNAASFNDITVAGTTTYRYQVRAYNLFSPSNYSNIADALTPAAPPPPAVPFTFRSVGTHYPTVDNTNGTGPGPRAVTPPATLQAGDLYVIVAAYRGNATLSMADTGGQTWAAEANTQANSVTARVFWTRFNGTWAGTPSVTNTAGTEALSVYSFAFATTAGMHPEIDVPVLSGSHSGGTVTVPSFATNTAGTLALVGWLSNENNSWSAPTTGWSVPGSQQWRNTTGEDTSLSLAYRVLTTAGATGTIARSQTDGPDPGLFFRLAWKQVPD